ncbi:MAG: HlyD family efflux transporter periplasmic adaptor subunit [Bacteroidetes bacterium]|nr:HlyD family efflux transporter periplasmic adaptor subunit [Bacteroidota bacterium]
MESNQYKIPVKSFSKIYRSAKKSNVRYWFWGLVIFLLLTLFLPWTQNIKSKGVITTLDQAQRLQKINSPIPGRIVKWWIREGSFVKKGDTLLQLTEIKEDYLDPNLVNQTKKQVEAKQNSIRYYESKIGTATTQIVALQEAKQLKILQLNNKLKQLGNKLTGEKAELIAIENELKLAKDQYERQQKMFDDGLVSQTQLQQRNISLQNVLAKKIVAENKLTQTEQEIINNGIEQNAVEQEYTEKIGKARGEQFQSMGQIANTSGEVAKLENQVSNYIIRNGMYFLLAPQDGQIVQSNKGGIGELVKEGEPITMIVPTRKDYVVEMYIRPVDLPLVNVNQKVRFMFDGFPAIVFSGWPDNSYGTFAGKIVMIENTISSNGMFRVLVAEDSTFKKWPKQIKIGSGAQAITLLKDVPIWYEFWRNINGFPPDYYIENEKIEKRKSK